MNDEKVIATLKQTIATLTRFIESKSTPNNAKAKALVTREQLQADLKRLEGVKS